MNPERKFARRTLLGAGLLGTGGALGWLVGRNRDERVPTPHPANKQALGAEFKYDVSAFMKTDPKHLLYEELAAVPTGFVRPKRLLVLKDQRVLVSGDRHLKVFANGVEQASYDLGRPAHCLLVTPEQDLLVGFKDHIATYDLEGREKAKSTPLGGKTYLTSLALVGDVLYMADAGNREIIKADRTGAVLARFGKKDGVNPGFAIPSPYFNISLGQDGNLKISNPGRLRVETYTLEGAFVSSWGEPGMNIDRFCGCCNPVYMTTTPEGDFITSEKGLARINVYDAAGHFKGAVAGPDMLVTDKELAKRACEDCTVGAGFDVAVGSDGHVYALDPFQKTIRTFKPLASTNA